MDPNDPVSERDQEADSTSQLVAMRMGALHLEGGSAGEVTADLRADLEILDGVPVDPPGHFRGVRVHSGPSSLHIVEPFRTKIGVELGGQMGDADRVQAIPAG